MTSVQQPKKYNLISSTFDSEVNKIYTLDHKQKQKLLAQYFQVQLYISILELAPVKQISQGPQFDKNGIIERSIVGKPEMFNRLKNQTLQGIKFNCLNQNIPSTAMKFVRRISSRRSTNVSAKVAQKQEESQRIKETKRNIDFDIVTKAELLKLIHQINQRIRENERKEEELLSDHSLPEQLQSSQQQRVLQKYQQQQQIWNDEINKSTQNTNRNNGESIISNAQCIQSNKLEYRKKVERLEFQEAVRNSLGEKTVNQWYLSLRQTIQMDQGQQDSYKERVFQDVNNKSSLIVDQTYKQLEIIRQPGYYLSHNNSVNKSKEQKSKLNSTASNMSFYQQQQLPFFKVTAIDEEQIEGLQVEGMSVFKIECDSVLEAASDVKFRLYKKQQEKIDENDDIDIVQ